MGVLGAALGATLGAALAAVLGVAFPSGEIARGVTVRDTERTCEEGRITCWNWKKLDDKSFGNSDVTGWAATSCAATCCCTCLGLPKLQRGQLRWLRRHLLQG